MKKSIPLKEIVGFLPYGLKMIFQSKGGRIVTVNGIKNLDHGIAVLNNSYSFWLHSSGFKPIVRPLSDLTKEITHNGEIIKPYEILFPVDEFDKLMDWTSLWCAEEFLKVEDKSELCYPMEFWEKLKELHFDIYDWIKDGLAVDINTI